MLQRIAALRVGNRWLSGSDEGLLYDSVDMSI